MVWKLGVLGYPGQPFFIGYTQCDLDFCRVVPLEYAACFSAVSSKRLHLERPADSGRYASR